MHDSEYDHNEHEDIYVDPTKNADVAIIRNYMKSINVEPTETIVYIDNDEKKEKKQSECSMKSKPPSMFCYYVTCITMLLILLYSVRKIFMYTLRKKNTTGSNEFNEIIKSNRVFTLREAKPTYRIA